MSFHFLMGRVVAAMGHHRRNSSLRRRVTGEALESRLLLAESSGLASLSWNYRGTGGGGSLYSPAISIHDPAEVAIASDVGQVFTSTNSGETWQPIHYRQLQGNRQSHIQYTDDDRVLYSIHSLDGYDISRPVKSTDGGETWTPLAGDPTGGETYHLFADPQDSNRLIVTAYDEMYASTDGGRSFYRAYEAMTVNGIHVAGAFFDGDQIYVGTNDGLIISDDGGDSFERSDVSGIPAGYGILGFAGASEDGQVRLFANVRLADDIWGGIHPAEDYWDSTCPSYRIFRLDVGASDWEPLFPCDIDFGDDINSPFPYFVDMAQNDIDTVYLAGGSEFLEPTVHRSTDGGDTWESVLLTDFNQNIETGWAGYRGDREWTYGETVLGLDVASANANDVVITDLGFAYRSFDGGQDWQALYVAPNDRNPSGRSTPVGNRYRGSGLDNTTSWGITWTDADQLWVANTDIRAQRSTDGGETFSFDYTGLDQNTTYWIDKHESGVLYAASGTVHDIYQTAYLLDEELDTEYDFGAVKYSSDNGANWHELQAFEGAVVWVSSDPTNPNRLYASVVQTEDGQSVGGIWVSDDIQNGSSSRWRKLAGPPRTEGRPFNIRVLNNGDLVVSYSARRAESLDGDLEFTASSGVFFSSDGGDTWSDRSDTNMRFFTKDVVIDPHDPSQATWYAAVWSGWGNSESRNRGGLYRTVDAGLTWTRLVSMDRVSSITVHPDNPDVAHVTTEREGLWYTENLTAPQPDFVVDENYSFRQPERVFYGPFDSGEIWVTSFGGGLRMAHLRMIGDFDFDGAVTSRDVDALCAAIASGDYDPRFDLDGDSALSTEDQRFLIRDVLQTGLGDANLDGVFDSTDLVLVFQVGLYEADSQAGWADGDWNCDGVFGTGDLVAAFQDGNYIV